MILRLPDVLRPAVAADLADALSRRRPATSAAGPDPVRVLVDALRADPLFMLGVQPRSFARPSFIRHDPTTRFDTRFDTRLDAREAVPPPPRVDVIATVFLSDPADYDGGELIIDTGYGDEPYKEAAGACVVHPAAARHRVAPVTRGVRWSSELTVQSTIRDPAQREILYDLGCALRYLELFGRGTPMDSERLRAVHAELLRLWAEP